MIEPSELRYRPFNASTAVQRFNSGNPDLDEFLNTAEVRHYDRQNLGRTTLVYYEGQLAAFFTVSVDGLRIDYLREKKVSKSIVKLGEVTTDRIPAIKIGRLAVDRMFQNKGIGRHLVKHIIGYALEVTKRTAIRLVIVESKPEAIDFYLKCGFRHTVETKGERRRRNKTLFFDLQSILESE